MALNTLKGSALEALGGDLGWSTFREKLIKATLRYKIRLERMDDERIARKVWNESGSKWRKRCKKMTADWTASGVGDEDGWEES